MRVPSNRIAENKARLFKDAAGGACTWGFKLEVHVKIGTNKDRFLATTLLAGMASLGVPLAVGVATMVAPTDALAQDYSNGTLSGSVVDATGAPVAGATVVIRSQAQGFERTTTTNANGEYRVPLIPQGLYTVVVSKDGLQTTSSEDLQVRVGAGNSYRIEMAGASEEEIVVTAARRTVEFTQSTTGVSIDVAETLTREPIARNITALTLLAPGAVPSDTAFGIASGQSLAPASISGASGAENAFFLNGLNITNFINGIGGATVPFDFYQTVEVKTGGYQAEFGRAIGGVVNAVSKSGSNDFTAALHINYAPNSLLADRPDSVLRQYSLYDNTTQDITLEVGGPIIPDHLFFYGLGQWQKSEFSTATAAGTYVDQRQGDPFYGFKIDGYITDTQHLELTYFDTTSQIKQELHSFDPATNEIDPTILSRNTVRQGGENYVARYTGAFTDWLTISAAYGRSTTDAASVTDLLNIPRVQDARSAPTVDLSLNRTAARTDPFLAEREFYRGDVDLYFDLLGEHHVRFGIDHENTTMTQTSTRNGGANYTVRTSGSAGNTGLGLGSNITYIERRVFDSGGGFDGENEAIYIQDSYDVTDRLNVSLGWRRDQMSVANPLGETFMEFDDEQAFRGGFSYDVFGDATGKLYGFYGRYYLPIPSNTSFRMAAPALDVSEFYVVGPGTPNITFDSSGQPVYGAQITNVGTTGPCPTAPGITSPGADACVVRNPGVAPDVIDTIGLDLGSTYEDEFLIGYEQQFNDLWSGGVSLTYRKLGRVAEDVGLDYALTQYCINNGLSLADPGCQFSGSDVFRIINPGEDATIHLSSPLPNGEDVVSLSAVEIGLPPVRREYIGLVFTLGRAWDGKWGLDASYTLSRSEGNFEGALKSDIGQVDPGITEDYDFLSFLPGQYGLLPNHRAHQLKVRGSYALAENFIVGGNFSVFSPRHYGCFGAAPDGYLPGPDFDGDGEPDYSDGNLTNDLYGVPANARFCGGVVVDRGSRFDTDWLYRTDISFRYDLPQSINRFGTVTLRADIFNLFDMQGVQEAQENGELAAGTPDPDYGRPTAYQTPRSVRFGVDITF